MCLDSYPVLTSCDLLGVDVAGDATRLEVLAALQDRILRAVSSPPADFDRPRYDALMRHWQELSAEASADACD